MNHIKLCNVLKYETTTYLFNFSFPRQTAFFASFRSLPVNGGPPFNMSYLNMKTLMSYFKFRKYQIGR